MGFSFPFSISLSLSSSLQFSFFFFHKTRENTIHVHLLSCGLSLSNVGNHPSSSRPLFILHWKHPSLIMEVSFVESLFNDVCDFIYDFLYSDIWEIYDFIYDFLYSDTFLLYWVDFRVFALWVFCLWRFWGFDLVFVDLGIVTYCKQMWDLSAHQHYWHSNHGGSLLSELKKGTDVKKTDDKRNGWVYLLSSS